MKLSIIIPVYNCEKYIKECLKSVIHQITEDCELIIINDGSTDKTEEIIKKITQNTSKNNFIYKKIENSGVSFARNLGVNISTGEYISFIDADDFVSIDYIGKITTATEQSASIIEFGYNVIDENSKSIIKNQYIHKNYGLHQSINIIDDIFISCLWYPFLRVVKRELFEDNKFPVGVRFCEDLMVFSEIYKKSKTILATSENIYFYRINSSGATFNIKNDYAPNLIEFYRRIINDNRLFNKALKINIAYTIRRCISETSDPIGRLPNDIILDVLKIIFTPRLLFCMRKRVMLFAVGGSIINYIKLNIFKK